MKKILYVKIILLLIPMLIFQSACKEEEKKQPLWMLALIPLSSNNSISSATTNTDYSYPSTTTISLTSGQSVTISPSQHVEGSTYSISPALPSGLSIDSKTGRISGTPTSSLAATVFTITQTKPDGTTVSWTITIAISGTNTGTTSNTTYTVGGTITGNLNSGTIVLRNNGANNLSRSSLGSFTFSTALSTSSTYNATIFTQPASATCQISNASGTISSSNISSIGVECAVCGDGVKASFEGCDDNNTVNGDGCSNACTVEVGYTCSGGSVAPSVCSAI